ncbi:WG repeat-containing protein [Myroides sp. M-43]|uniref:WG repeat-containing protein n=1 Tax=Myroides oncorhynchi TaxID=2893756 RepID=UPI001E64DEA1|nr:WG repeat-containing protein [Myroides oncorhynchi]MCC9041237.1 WG repeat-containing protein [Myroides oncorhynchi]
MKRISLLIIFGALSFSCSNDNGDGKKEKPIEKPDYQPKVLIPFEERGLWGFRDPQENVVVVVPQYEAVKDFDEHKIARVKKSKLWGLIDMLGKSIILPTYNDIENFSGQGYATVVKLEKSGVINTKGEEKVEPVYDKVFGYYDKQYVRVQADNKFGIIDKDWKLIIKPTYTKIREFGTDGVNANHIIVEQTKKRGLINKEWKTIAEAKYDSITKFDTKGIAFLIDSLKVGMVNAEGRLLEPKYNIIKESNDEKEVTYKVVLAEKWGLLNKDWKEIISPRFEADFKIFEFDKSGYARLHVGDKWGFIDSNHKVLLEPIYDEITEFDIQGFARIKVGEKWGVINRSFKVLLEPIYDDITGFNAEGYARVIKDKKLGVINKDWKIVLPIEYDNIGDVLPYGMTRLTQNGKLGLADKTWNVVLPVMYKDVKMTDDNGFVQINNDVIAMENAVGLFDVKTHKVLEPAYKTIGSFDQNGHVLVQSIDSRFNLLNKSLVEGLAESFDNIEFLKDDNTYRVTKGIYVGVYSNSLMELVKADRYMKIFSFEKDNKAIVESGLGRRGLIDRQWKEVLATRYYQVQAPDGKMNRILDNRDKVGDSPLYNFYTGEGKTLESDYKEIKIDYNNGVILLSGLSGKYGFATENLNVVVDAEYGHPFVFTNAQVSAFEQNGLWGIMNKQGVKVISATYDRITGFSEEGYANVIKGGLYGFVNASGLLTVEAKYEMVDQKLIRDNLSKVRLNGYAMIINYINGTELFKPGSVSDVDNLFNGYASFEIGGKWGIKSKGGNEVSKVKYDKIDRFNSNDNTVRMYAGRYVGVMNSKGVIIIEANTYESIGLFSEGKATASRNGIMVTVGLDGKEI